MSPWAGAAYLTGCLAAAAVFVVVQNLGVMLAFAVLPFPVVLHLTYRAFLSRQDRRKHPVAVRTNGP